MKNKNQMYRLVEVISYEPRNEKPIAGYSWVNKQQVDRQYRELTRKYPNMKIAIQTLASSKKPVSIHRS